MLLMSLQMSLASISRFAEALISCGGTAARGLGYIPSARCMLDKIVALKVRSKMTKLHLSCLPAIPPFFSFFLGGGGC